MKRLLVLWLGCSVLFACSTNSEPVADAVQDSAQPDQTTTVDQSAGDVSVVTDVVDQDGVAEDVSPEEDSSTPLTPATYHGQIKEIFAQKCVGCHQEGNIAPFPLTTLEEIQAVLPLIAHSVEAETMPPWPPDSACNSYELPRSLTQEQKDMVLSWVGDGAPEGTLGEEVPPAQEEELDFDLDLVLPEPYTPTPTPDDYRCQIVDWPYEDVKFVTGFHVVPDKTEIVHHTIAFVISGSQRDEYEALDAANEGVGYPCFGGPGGTSFGDDGVAFKWLASWAPGGLANTFPTGTGIRVDPGSFIVLQMHYNMGAAEPVSDQSMVRLMIADEVEDEAMVIPYTNPMWLMGSGIPGVAMTIPAGEAEVSHETTNEYGGASILTYLVDAEGFDTSRPLVVYNVGLHMHNLGSSAELELVSADGDKQCMVRINDWDFGWQGGYDLATPLVVNPGDKIRLRCTWDNSVENQPIIDGAQIDPKEVAWGDGTGDEMCLGVIYVTVPGE